MTFFRCRGKGGQKQNKTSSDVRIKHIKSGIVAESREERSQTQNKRRALERLSKDKKFILWCQMRINEIISGEMTEEWIDRQMQPGNLKIEFI